VGRIPPPHTPSLRLWIAAFGSPLEEGRSFSLSSREEFNKGVLQEAHGTMILKKLESCLPLMWLKVTIQKESSSLLPRNMRLCLPKRRGGKKMNGT
jgi:hypothetical protein